MGRGAGIIQIRRDAVIDVMYALFAFFLGEEWFIEESASQQGSGTNGIHRLIWRFLDASFRMASGIKPLQYGESHLFSIARHRYLGRPFTVDGIRVRRFSPVIEIHMNNKVVAEVIREEGSVVSLAARLIKEANRSFPVLANAVASPKYRKAEILYGITFIHRGVDRFGFTTLPIQNNPARHFLAWYLRNIFRMTNPNACSLFASRPEIFCPKMVAISKLRLIQENALVHDGRLRTRSTVEVQSK